MGKRISFEAGGDEENYVTKCNTCKHSYTRKDESDTLFCSLKECRYEPIRRVTDESIRNRKN